MNHKLEGNFDVSRPVAPSSSISPLSMVIGGGLRAMEELTAAAPVWQTNSAEVWWGNEKVVLAISSGISSAAQALIAFRSERSRSWFSRNIYESNTAQIARHQKTELQATLISWGLELGIQAIMQLLKKRSENLRRFNTALSIYQFLCIAGQDPNLEICRPNQAVIAQVLGRMVIPPKDLQRIVQSEVPSRLLDVAIPELTKSQWAALGAFATALHLNGVRESKAMFEAPWDLLEWCGISGKQARILAIKMAKQRFGTGSLVHRYYSCMESVTQEIGFSLRIDSDRITRNARLAASYDPYKGVRQLRMRGIKSVLMLGAAVGAKLYVPAASLAGKIAAIVLTDFASGDGTDKFFHDTKNAFKALSVSNGEKESTTEQILSAATDLRKLVQSVRS